MESSSQTNPEVRPRLITLLLASSLTVLAAAIIAPSLNSMKHHFIEVESVDFLVRLVLTTPALFIVIGSPVAGWLADTFGRKPVLLVGMLFYAVAGSSGLYFNTLPLILAGRACLGLAVACVMTAATTLLTDFYEGEERVRVLGLQASFMGLGGVVFLLLGGFLADVSWRLPFATYLLAAPLLVPAFLFLREPNASDTTEDEDAVLVGASRARMPWHVVLPVVVLVFTVQACFYLIPVQIPFRFDALGYPEPWRVSVAVATLSGCFALSASQAATFRRRLGLAGCYGIGFAVSGVGLFFISQIDDFLTLIPPFALMGLGFGLLMPNLSAWLAAEAPQRMRGRAMGMFSASLFLGQFMSPVLAQPLIERSSLTAVYVGAAALCVVVAPLAAWLAPSGQIGARHSAAKAQ